MESSRPEELVRVGEEWITAHQDQVSAELLRRVVEELIATKMKLPAKSLSQATDKFLDQGHPLEWVQELGRELTAAMAAPASEKALYSRGHHSGNRHA